MMKLFQPVKKGAVSLRVSDAIREAIFSSKLRPGDALFEAHLAKDFRVSQTSVREGLLNLEQYGLVRRVRNRGTFVTKLSAEDISERVAVHTTLEEMACIQAARRLREEHFKELSKRARAVSTTVSQNAYSEVPVAEFNFHHYVWENSGNRFLCQTLDQVSAPLFAFAGMLRSARAENLKRGIRISHQEIVSALRGGKPETIRNAIKAHINHSYNGI